MAPRKLNDKFGIARTKDLVFKINRCAARIFPHSSLHEMAIMKCLDVVSSLEPSGLITRLYLVRVITHAPRSPQLRAIGEDAFAFQQIRMARSMGPRPRRYVFHICTRRLV